MTDQNNAGTPGSNADVSVNGSKSHTPKDKVCPFCQQQFTSSSLGRHLDLYIKEKNPKPADGLHDVEEIRKMRGGITRRQPRNSAVKREHSDISVSTPSSSDRRTSRTDVEREKNRSPSLRKFEGVNTQTPLGNQHGGSSNISTFINRGTWEGTGVMNNISAPWNSDSRSMDGEERDSSRRPDVRNRSVSRKILAKTSFEQKQKIIDALDNAKAAELALRELVGSLRAAKQQAQSSSVLEYDPLTMDFPALCLHCLPPPPTLHTNTPIPSSSSWSLSPPEETQFHALRNHFTSVFHSYRISLSVSNNSSKHDVFSPQTQYSTSTDTQNFAANAETTANQLESKINTHLQAIFRAWQALPSTNRSEIWTLSLARSIALKSNQIDKLKRDIEGIAQDAAHLRQQVDELSRLQCPREFKIVPPCTTRVESETMAALGERILDTDVEGRTKCEKLDAVNGSTSCGSGINILDRSISLETAVERAISRWKTVVKEVRAQTNDQSNFEKGISAQQSLNVDGVNARERVQPPSIQAPAEWDRANQGVKNDSNATGTGSDADADADMEEDASSFVEMVDAPPALQSQQLHHQNHQPQMRDHGFRVSAGNGNGNGAANNSFINGGHSSQTPNNSQNGNSNASKNSKVNTSNGRGMEGIDNQAVGGYVRIGA